MKRLGHIVAVLAFAFALLAGAVGGAMAHAGPMDHHGSHHAPADTLPSHDGPHKAAPAMAAPCCPAAEAPARQAVAVAVTMVAVVWHPRPEYLPGARDVTPEPPPPKASL